MNLPQLFVTTLMSMSNLTHLLNRLIIDGEYKTVLLVYDYDDVTVRDTNIVNGLADLTNAEYAVCITKERVWKIKFHETVPFQHRRGVLKVLMLNKNRRFSQFIYGQSLTRSEQNIVLLLPMQPDNRKELRNSHFSNDMCFINTSVIFYQTESTMRMAITSKNPIEIYALNYKVQYLSHSAVDVMKSVYNGPLNERNLHDNIFGSITKKPNLVLFTVTTVKESLTKTPIGRGKDELINLGNADYYHSNFIARNLRGKDVAVQQVIEYLELHPKWSWPRPSFHNCTASNEEVYAELYNLPSGVPRDAIRFDFINSMRQNEPTNFR